MTRRELLRRVVHVALGAGAFLLPLLGWRTVALVAALAIPFNLWILPRWRPTAFLHRRDASGHAGLVLYPAVVLVALLVFREDHEPVQVAWLALALADGLAPLLGLRLTRPRWPHLPRKSIGASAAAAACAGVAMLLVTTPPLALAGAAGAFAGEGASWRLDDNVAVPAGAVLSFLVARSLLVP